MTGIVRSRSFPARTTYTIKPRIGAFSGLDNTIFSGPDTRQCPKCWEVFGSVTGFTMHRDSIPGACEDPGDFGLSLRDGAWS